MYSSFSPLSLELLEGDSTLSLASLPPLLESLLEGVEEVGELSPAELVGLRGGGRPRVRGSLLRSEAWNGRYE